ncbi:hypothetical protein H0H92_000323 [Tricholoma furcatifolium]|nr:hypothetical protein H0H92_000323 [Tricholoma furcatifolium]
MSRPGFDFSLARAVQLYQEITGRSAQKYRQRKCVRLDEYPLLTSPVRTWKQRHDEVQRIADRMAFEETILILALNADYFDSEHLEVSTQFFRQGVEINDPDDATKIVIESLHVSSQKIYDWSVEVDKRCQIQQSQKTIKFLGRTLGHPASTIRAMLSNFPRSPAVEFVVHRNRDRDI